MKIPVTPPGSTPYFHGQPVNGMELNPAWQANGVMVEGGSSNNNNGPYMMQQQTHHQGVLQPQPHHAVPNSESGYSSTPYYPPSEPEDSPEPPHNQDFSEYMWMENQEEFDKQVFQQLEEEALMEQCIEAMLADEREAMGRTSDVSLEEQVSRSTLNPLAAEFVPSFLPTASVSTVPDESSSATAAYSVSNVELPTESLKELSLSKTSAMETSLPPLTESAATKDENVDKTNEEQQASHSSDSIVVVSAKNILTPKSSIDDSDRASSKSRESKDTDKKKGDAKKKDMKKEKIVTAAAVTAAVVASKTSTKPSTQRTRTLSGGDKNKATGGDKKQQASNSTATNRKGSDKGDAAVVLSKKQEVKVDDTVDLQGPPLPAVSVPVVSALSSAPGSEPEKQPVPSTPAVFNYAAAARANLPAKQPTQPQAQPVPSKEATPVPNARVTSTVVNNTTSATTNKSQLSSAPNKTDSAPKPKSAKSGEKGNAGEAKKSAPKGTSGGTKKGKK